MDKFNEQIIDGYRCYSDGDKSTKFDSYITDYIEIPQHHPLYNKDVLYYSSRKLVQVLSLGNNIIIIM